MNFGKFKDAESLLRSYENLEKEFTKKCQELAKLRLGKKMDVEDSIQENFEKADFVEEKNKNKGEKFTSEKIVLDKACPPEEKECSGSKTENGGNYNLSDLKEAENVRVSPFCGILEKVECVIEKEKLSDNSFSGEEENENENIENDNETKTIKTETLEQKAIEESGNGNGSNSFLGKNAEGTKKMVESEMESDARKQPQSLIAGTMTDEELQMLLDKARADGIIDYIKRVLDKKSNTPTLLGKAGRGDRLIYQSGVKPLENISEAGEYILKNYF